MKSQLWLAGVSGLLLSAQSLNANTVPFDVSSSQNTPVTRPGPTRPSPAGAATATTTSRSAANTRPRGSVPTLLSAIIPPTSPRSRGASGSSTGRNTGVPIAQGGYSPENLSGNVTQPPPRTPPTRPHRGGSSSGSGSGSTGSTGGTGGKPAAVPDRTVTASLLALGMGGIVWLRRRTVI